MNELLPVSLLYLLNISNDYKASAQSSYPEDPELEENLKHAALPYRLDGRVITRNSHESVS